ncbi:hypothetical protein V5F49_12795 [Xanthobacter sp. V3C-3]|uniref:hypothetical protein n=1 Tax=Xanthobacter lutulentifluminis TaxID=3119935 RepID=UPI00372A6D88
MERMERTARMQATARPAQMRVHGHPYPSAEAEPDVPAWDVLEVPSATIEKLRSEVAALRERLATAAPKRAVVEMDKAITLLCRRVDDIREAGAARDAQDGTVSAELAAIRAGLDEMRRRDRSGAIEGALDTLARKIDLIGARAVDPVEVARLQTQIEELGALVTRAVAGIDGNGALQRLAERLAACAVNVAEAGEDAARRVAEATGVFERKAEALLSRVMEMEARARAGDDAAAEDLRRSLLGALEGVHHRLDEMASLFSGQLSALSPAIGAEVGQRLADLTARVAAAEAAGHEAVAPLADVVERHLLALSARFADTHARLDRLDDMELSLQRLVEEMRQVRETTHAATAEAVAAVAAKVSDDPAGAAVIGLKRGLAALEARQDQIERRAGEMLAAELEMELDGISVALSRDEDGSYAPRTAAPRPERPRPAPAAGTEDAAPEDAAPASAATDTATAGPASPAAPSAPPRGEGATRNVHIPWPEGTRPGERPAGDNRPRMERRSRAKRPDKARAPGLMGRLFPREMLARKRHMAMVALIAGATTVFAGTLAGIAWRNGPDILSGVTGALRRLTAPAVAGVTGAGLPAPIGPAALQAAASGGDAAAAFLVAQRYAEGRGVEADPEAAVKWLAFAMQKGSAPAAHRLGAMYEAAGRELGEARRFYEWSAEHGNVRAMHALAMLLSDGTAAVTGGKPDWAGALRWFRAAAELGYRDSQYNLGVVYARGLGVAADLGEAYKWLALAAAQGDEDSARKRDIVAADADPATLARARQAVSAFSPGTPIAAANTVTVAPEWNDAAGEAASSSAARAKKPTRVASAATPAL